MSQLLGGEGGIGVVTFARFYAIHVLLLPPVTMLLIAVHVYLVRKHGVAPAPGDETKPKKTFYPEQVFKDTVAIFVAFAILFALAVDGPRSAGATGGSDRHVLYSAPRMVLSVPVPDS